MEAIRKSLFFFFFVKTLMHRNSDDLYILHDFFFFYCLAQDIYSNSESCKSECIDGNGDSFNIPPKCNTCSRILVAPQSHDSCQREYCQPHPGDIWQKIQRQLPPESSRYRVVTWLNILQFTVQTLHNNYLAQNVSSPKVEKPCPSSQYSSVLKGVVLGNRLPGLESWVCNLQVVRFDQMRFRFQ